MLVISTFSMCLFIESYICTLFVYFYKRVTHMHKKFFDDKTSLIKGTSPLHSNAKFCNVMKLMLRLYVNSRVENQTEQLLIDRRYSLRNSLNYYAN